MGWRGNKTKQKQLPLQYEEWPEKKGDSIELREKITRGLDDISAAILLRRKGMLEHKIANSCPEGQVSIL